MNNKDTLVPADMVTVRELPCGSPCRLRLALRGDDYFIVKDFSHSLFRTENFFTDFEKHFAPWIKLPPHPFTVPLEAATFHGTSQLVTRYIAPDIRGFNSLEHYLKLSPPDTRQSLIWMIQVCDALCHAARHGIPCHGNLSPCNILIGADGRALVTDFQVRSFISSFTEMSSRAISQETLTARLYSGSPSLFSTCPFMEVKNFLQNDKKCTMDSSGDIHAIGSLLCLMLRRNPRDFDLTFETSGLDKNNLALEDFPGTLHRILTVSEGKISLLDIIKKCLTPSEDGYETMDELLADLKGALQNLFHVESFNYPVGHGWDILNTALAMQENGRAHDSLEILQNTEINNDIVQFIRLYTRRACYMTDAPADKESAGPGNRHLQRHSQYLKAMQSLEAGTNRKRYSSLLSYSLNNPHDLSLLFHLLQIHEDPDMDLLNDVYLLPLFERMPALKAYYFLFLSLYFIQKGNAVSAITFLDEIIKKDGKNFIALYLKGRLLLRMGYHNESLLFLNRSEYYHPGFTPTLVELGAACHEGEEYEQSLAWYHAAYRAHPHDAEVLSKISSLLLKKGDRKGALDHYLEALKLDPENRDSLYNAGNIFFNSGDFSGALDYYLFFHESNPRDMYTLNKIGQCYQNLGKTDKALDFYDRALEISPADPYTLNNKGAALQSIDMERALNYFERALEAKPDYGKAMFNRGLTLFKKEEYEKALDAFKKAIDTTPGLSQAWLYRGLGEEKTQRTWEAIHSLEHYLTLTEKQNSSHSDFARQKVNELRRKNRLSTGASLAMNIAHQKARNSGSLQVMPEHLLAGLFRLRDITSLTDELSLPVIARKELEYEHDAFIDFFEKTGLDYNRTLVCIQRYIHRKKKSAVKGTVFHSEEVKEALAGAANLFPGNNEIQSLSLLAVLFGKPLEITALLKHSLGLDIQNLKEAAMKQARHYHASALSSSNLRRYIMLVSSQNTREFSYINYIIIHGNRKMPFRIKLTRSQQEELMEEIESGDQKLNNRIIHDRPVEKDLKLLRNVLKSFLTNDRLNMEIENIQRYGLHIQFDHKLDGIPWELALPPISPQIMPLYRRVDIDAPASAWNLDESEKKILLVTGSGEEIPGFNEQLKKIKADLLNRTSGGVLTTIRAESEGYLLAHLVKNPYSAVIYYGHARSSESPSQTGWVCENGDIFSCSSLQRLKGHAPRLIISNGCESAKASPIGLVSFPRHALKAGTEYYIGTRWFLEINRSLCFFTSFFEQWLSEGKNIFNAFGETLENLKELYGDRDVSRYNYLFYYRD